MCTAHMSCAYGGALREKHRLATRLCGSGRRRWKGSRRGGQCQAKKEGKKKGLQCKTHKIQDIYLLSCLWIYVKTTCVTINI